MDSDSFIQSLGVGVVVNPVTTQIRDDLMHQLDSKDVGTWKSYNQASRRYIVPDHLRTLCPHCEKEDVLLRYVSSREVPLCSKEEDRDGISPHSIVGKAKCSNCGQDSDIILHGYKQAPGLEIWIHPKPIDATAKAPEGTPIEFARDYREAVEVLGISPNASAALARRGIERVLREHYKINADSLANCISNAIKQKLVPSELSDILDAARTIGNHGAHPLESGHSGEIIEVSKEEVLLSLEILKYLLDYAFARAERKKKARLAEKYKLQG